MPPILTQQEADRLIEMLKKTVREMVLKFPEAKGKLEFNVIGKRRRDEFVINIERKGINYQSCSAQGRIKADDTILLRLDVNPNTVHKNPETGEIIEGTHLHIYSEEFGTEMAIPFDMKDKKLHETCMVFFEKFHIIEPPTIQYNQTLFE